MRSQPEDRFILCKYEVELRLKCIAIEDRLMLRNRCARSIDALLGGDDGALAKTLRVTIFGVSERPPPSGSRISTVPAASE